MSIIRSKLPEEILIQLEIEKGVEVNWTVVTLSKQLHEYVVARERAIKERSTDTSSKSERYGSNTTFVKSSVQKRGDLGANGVSKVKSSASALVTTGT